MMSFVKVLIILAVMAVLAYPLLPLPLKIKKYSTFYSLRFNSPNQRKNIFFVLLALVCFIFAATCLDLLESFGEFLYSLPLVGKLYGASLLVFNGVKNLIGSHINFILFCVTAVAVNFLILYGFVIAKGILKALILDKAYKIEKPKEKRKPCFIVTFFKNLFSRRKKKKKGGASGNDDNNKAENFIKKFKNSRIPKFDHTTEDDEEALDTSDENKVADGEEKENNEDNGTDEKNTSEKEEEKEEKHGFLYRFFCNLIFEGDEFEYARGWAIRVRMVLQTFIFLIEALYAVFFFVLLVAVFFPLPTLGYDLLINGLHINEWYIYPFISIIFLQEICNFLNAPAMPVESAEDIERKEEESEEIVREARLRALQSELKKRFDSEHLLRYYSEAEKTNENEYVCTNKTFASAMQYIRKYMQENYGSVMQSYMECLDAMYNENHVYFPASFYSEFGEYLVAYTYIRLLSGARMIFIVSDPAQCESLKKTIRSRLIRMTGSSAEYTWRVYTADERLDQADVLIASPDDFKDDNIVEQFPAFFEEVSNAIFIDADRIVALDSYLCLIMARRLQKATDDRIRFAFLTLDWLQGFATSSIPKFFCIEKVLSFSSAAENEEVSYTLWQKESKNHRIYNKNGQKLTSLECILAELACEYGVDGVRLLSEAPLGHAEKKILALHNVEINNMYKDVADVNYMIYSDERCNLSAALYACMRFRGKKKSIVHILSKPYLLREYFMFKAAYEMYVNRSSFIKPRVTEHADRFKISLLRIFCDVTSGKGIPVEEFEDRMRKILEVSIERNDKSTSAFCRDMLDNNSISSLRYKKLAAFLVASLYDDANCPADESIGHRAKDFYIVIDPNKQDGYALYEERYIIFNRVRDVFDKLLACNRRVALSLNDEIIGLLDTFPSRVHLEYLEGQSLIYNNSEYEIDHISEDGTTIFLRSENTGIRNCLDTVLLRRYQINSITPYGKEGVLHNTKSLLEEIKVSQCKINYTGETYGFYSLMTDRQTIDFYRGVEGNPHVTHKHVREIQEGRALLTTLVSQKECTDGMRLLLAAVFNEFVRTIFPMAYRCIAICPVLMNPLAFDDEHEPNSEEERISALYPYLKTPSADFVETDPKRMQFIFINDCEEDIGALDWFYDKAARYMQDFLANVYSYLHWLHKNATRRKHYIYFGGDELPKCYDLDGCCELLENYNLILSDDGKKDYETAGSDEILEETERCAFCHRIMESGRYSLFDSNRYICADCFNTVDKQSELENLHDKVLRYLKTTYPKMRFGSAKVDFDNVYELQSDQILSEFYYRLDTDSRTVFVERDTPENNAEVSILRGIVELWQTDNNLLLSYARAQLYFEELLYLRSIGKEESADWIYNELNERDENLRICIDEIANFVGVSFIKKEETPTEGEDSEKPELPANEHTSFEFMRLKSEELDKEDTTDTEDSFDDDEYSSEKLYDPNKIPRFWKRYLKNEHIDDGNEEDVSEGEIGDDDDDGDASENEVALDLANAPAPNDVLTDEPAETPAEETVEETAEETVDDTAEETVEETADDNGGDDGNGNDNNNSDVSDGDSEDGKKNKKDKKEKKEKPKKEKKDKGSGGIGGWFSKFKKNKDSSDSSDDGGNGTSDKDGKSKKSKKKSKKTGPRRDRNGNRVGIFKKLSNGEKIVPYEDEEATNKKLRLYNEIARNCFNYSEDPIPRNGISENDMVRIFRYVLGDYPEIFWVSTFAYTSNELILKFRCVDSKGKIDKKQVNEKRKALRKGAKSFTAGITRFTDPYKALLTIYRRVILTLDYDGKGLDAGVDRDMRKDDSLRSLYSALVEHKVVCAGYAAAMQYLLQSVGLVCGYVISENSGDICHAFNIVKIGKQVYYLDATWGDSSDTKSGDLHANSVWYDYFCSPYDEFTHHSTESMHIPRKELYPDLEIFKHTTHEYFRYHNAYLKKYSEEDIVRIFADAAKAYSPKNGEFAVGIRFIDGTQMQYAHHRLCEKNELGNVLAKAALTLKKNRKAAERLEQTQYKVLPNSRTGTIYFIFDNVND